MRKISVLIPTHNEEDNVVPLSDLVIKEFSEKLSSYDYEIVFIDNDSKDSTRNKIRSLCASNSKIKAIFNVRNFGQFSSPYYGLLQTSGDCTIMMCADFQDPVELIPKYVKEWEAGYKIVLGQKVASRENGFVYRMRGLYYKIMRRNSEAGFIEHVTGSGLYDREFIELLRGLDEPRPFLRGMVTEMGYNIKLVEYEQPKRRAGKSSNSIFGYYDAAMQGLTTYTKFSVRLAVFIGTLFTTASFFVSVGFGLYKIFNWSTFSLGPYLLNLAILLMVSLNLLFIGLVGEYILNINSRMKKRPLVIESERINF